MCETSGGHRGLGTSHREMKFLTKQCIHQEQSPVYVWDEVGLEHFRGIKEE